MLTGVSSVIRLNVNRCDLSILSLDSVTLASVGAEYGSRGKFDIEGTGEISASISKEADAAGLVGVKGLAPCIHAVDVRSVEYKLRGELEEYLHESIVDRDDKDLTGAGELRMSNETGNVAVRASWA